MMEKIKNRVKIPKTAVVLLLLLLGIMQNGFTECTLLENSYLFAHQTFRNGSWKVAADSLDAVIPQVLCDNKPYRYIAAGSYDSSLAASVDSAGNVSIVKARLIPDICRSQFVADDPVATSVIIGKDAPAGLLSNQYLDKLYLAVRNNDSSVVVVTLTANGKLVRADTVNFADNGASAITSITSDGVSNTGFMVCGTKGLLRFIPLSNGATGAPQVYDLTSGNDLVYADYKYAVSTDGTVYRFSDGTGFVKDSEVASPVLFASDRVICSAAQIAILQSGIWVEYPFTSAIPVMANVSFLSAGTTLEYTDASVNWALQKKLIADNPTVGHVLLAPLFDNYIYEPRIGFTDTLIFVTSDPDSNAKLPQISLSGSLFSGSIFDGSTYKLEGMGADIQCILGTAKIVSDTFRILMRSDSIIYEANSLLGVNNFVCNTANWAKRKIRCGKPWAEYSKCIIAIQPSFSLSISNGPSIAVRRHDFSAAQKYGSDFSFRKMNVICKFSGDKPHPAGTMSLWAINGRNMGEVRFSSDAKTVSVAAGNIRQLIIARIRFTDGTGFEGRVSP